MPTRKKELPGQASIDFVAPDDKLRVDTAVPPELLDAENIGEVGQDLAQPRADSAKPSNPSYTDAEAERMAFPLNPDGTQDKSASVVKDGLAYVQNLGAGATEAVIERLSSSTHPQNRSTAQRFNKDTDRGRGLAKERMTETNPDINFGRRKKRR